MKLDPTALRYLSRDDFRVLTAVEQGQKNHDLVPRELVVQIADLRHGGAEKMLQTCLRHKLLHHETLGFDGYRLTTLGYDFLALRALVAKGLVSAVGKKLGVGKESDIFLVENDDGQAMVLKLHRLGRTSFRKIKAKRDYHGQRGSPSWLYLSRLAAQKEFSFMKALKENGFPVPDPIEANRHCILMSLLDGYPLHMVYTMEKPEAAATEMLDLIVRLGRVGLIHGDFNEFNVAVAKEDSSKIVMYDFPQMVSMSHPNARMYFERDVNCVTRFFRTRFNLNLASPPPTFDQVFAEREKALDVAVAVSGFSRKDAAIFDRMLEQSAQAQAALRDAAGSNSSGSGGEEEEDGESGGGELERGSAAAAAPDQGDDAMHVDDDDEEEEDGEVFVHDDGPQAYHAHDYVRAEDEHEPGKDGARRVRRVAGAASVKERVAKEVGARVKRDFKGSKSSRNRIKSRDQRRVKESMNLDF